MNVQNQPWAPQLPPPDKFDWIQFNSGELLKGELRVLYEDEREFESDELDLLTIDWEDVKQVRGHRCFSIRFEGPITVDGFLELNEDNVYVALGKSGEHSTAASYWPLLPGNQKRSIIGPAS